jgi:putative glycosyltransferase (TIGR04372 family)
LPQSIVRRAADFALRQAIKLIKRPSRLFFLTLSFFPRLARFVLPILPDRWIKTPNGTASCIETGYHLFQRDHPTEAWQWFERAIRVGRPTADDNLLAAICLYHGLGRFRDAMSLLRRANESGIAEAKAPDIVNNRFRVLDGFWARHIGNTAELDYIIKLGILEGRSREETILFLPSGSPVANRFLFQQLAAHLRLVEDPADLPFDVSAMRALRYDPLAPRMPDGKTVYIWEAAGKTYARWQQEGRGPILSLPSETEARGWEALHRAGVPQGAWFVAMHVREGKWYGHNTGPRGILNADITTYLPAIAEITRRGGWVLRMGDPGMKSLPALPNVIDYCHSELRADWMDVFIASRCRFMLATSSGPAYIPPLYGVPSVLTNWWPPAQRPWHASDIFIPKLMRKTAAGRYLSLSETLIEPFSYCHSRRYLAEHEGIHVEDNDPEIIRAAVEEMLVRLEGGMNDSDSPDVSDLRLRAEQIYRSHGAPEMGQLARVFLQYYASLIA